MPPKDAAVSLLGEKVLIDNGLNLKSDVKINYQSNHFGCMKQLIIRKVDACVTADVPKKLFEHRSGVTLQVLNISEPIPTSLFAVHSRQSTDVINAIKARMLDWKNSNEGRKILDDLQFEAIIEANDSDYDVVRNILDTIK